MPIPAEFRVPDTREAPVVRPDCYLIWYLGVVGPIKVAGDLGDTATI
jgi:hypothetical protein